MSHHIPFLLPTVMIVSLSVPQRFRVSVILTGDFGVAAVLFMVVYLLAITDHNANVLLVALLHIAVRVKENTHANKLERKREVWSVGT